MTNRRRMTTAAFEPTMMALQVQEQLVEARLHKQQETVENEITTCNEKFGSSDGKLCGPPEVTI